MELLRFTTAGSVDDGKSTLIGRLLYDSKSIFEDQLDQVKQSSERKGLTHTDLALLTDGLKEEREQGIRPSSGFGARGVSRMSAPSPPVRVGDGSITAGRPCVQSR